MVISTSSVAVAQCAGSVVKFGSRDPLGAASENIFMAHATGGADRQPFPCKSQKLKESVSKILSICCGLPIALSIAGCAVAFLMNSHDDFERACDAYAIQLENKTTCLGGEDSLNSGILLSLEYLEVEFRKLKRKKCLHTEHTLRDLYVSLCVLDNQAWVTPAVLNRLWEMEKVHPYK